MLPWYNACFALCSLGGGGGAVHLRQYQAVHQVYGQQQYRRGSRHLRGGFARCICAAGPPPPPPPPGALTHIIMHMHPRPSRQSPRNSPRSLPDGSSLPQWRDVAASMDGNLIGCNHDVPDPQPVLVFLNF